jgi:hypothetical protein
LLAPISKLESPLRSSLALISKYLFQEWFRKLLPLLYSTSYFFGNARCRPFVRSNGCVRVSLDSPPFRLNRLWLLSIRLTIALVHMFLIPFHSQQSADGAHPSSLLRRPPRTALQAAARLQLLQVLAPSLLLQALVPFRLLQVPRASQLLQATASSPLLQATASLPLLLSFAAPACLLPPQLPP